MLLINSLISRTNDLIRIVDLFNSMSTPAGNTGDGKQRCEQLLRDAQHSVNKAGVHIDISANWLFSAAFSKELRSELFDSFKEVVFILKTVLNCKALGNFLKNFSSWIGARQVPTSIFWGVSFIPNIA